MFSLTDAHLGKLAYVEESGDTSHFTSACQVVSDSICSRTADALHHGLERNVAVVGNDLLQTDSPRDQTYTDTQVDVSNRYWNVFKAARDLMVGEIEWLNQYAPVTVMVAPGNHDLTANAHLGHVLGAWFSKHPDVTVDASLRPREYHQFGRVLLGFADDNEKKHTNVPQIMASESKQVWATNLCREWITGHWHRENEKQFQPSIKDEGVTIRVTPVLDRPDAWHAPKKVS